MNPKGRFQEALKQFDNKDYKGAKKSCDKILEKNPTNEEALALKGLTVYYLKEKEEGKKLINQALKINMKSPVAWHFYALYQKEECNYAQALRCYLQATKYDQTNYNIIRDLSYLQLYLRQINSFAEYSKKAVDIRPGQLINWVTYAFANALIGNYEAASKLVELTQESGEGIKKNEKNELILFDALMKNKAGKYKEAIQLLIDNQKDVIDSTLLYENIVKNALLVKKYDVGIEYCMKAIENNCENVNYFIWLFNMRINEDNFVFKEYDDLLSIEENSKYLPTLYDIINKELKPKFPKSKVIARLEIAFSNGEVFKQIFNEYFIKNVKSALPSFFINVKFIYVFQKYKLKLIEDILSNYLNSIEKTQKVTNELDNISHICWVYFYSAQHYSFLGDEEKALLYINKAIDMTPTVVEFYMTKSKILKHGYMLEESLNTYEKAKELDLGDRYLNAKYAKIFLRLCDVNKSTEIMKQFVKDPLKEANIDNYHCKWFENECGNAFIQNEKYLHAHQLFKAILRHYANIFDEQSDFYAYCLRKFMINDLYQTYIYLDKIRKNRYVYQAITKLDLLYSFIKEKQGELGDKLQKEFDEMKEEGYVKYTYTAINELLKDIENDVYNTLKKLQNICKDEMIHYYCVKFFIIKSKSLMAFKSLMFLSKNCKSSFAYYMSMKIFKEYYESNKAKMKEQIYYDKIEEVLKADDGKEWENKDKLKNLAYKMYLNGKFKSQKDNEQYIKEIFNIGDKLFFRMQKQEIITELFVWTSLFVDNQDMLNQLKKNLREKMKLDVKEEDIKNNLSFYEDKKDYSFTLREVKERIIKTN